MCLILLKCLILGGFDNILSVDFDVETGICFDINVEFELVSRKCLILLGLRGFGVNLGDF